MRFLVITLLVIGFFGCKKDDPTPVYGAVHSFPNNWSSVGFNTSIIGGTMVIGKNNKLYVSSYGYGVLCWNGSTWDPVGNLNANGMVTAIYADSSGNVFVAGNFTNSGGKYYVSKWDGINWLELGQGASALNANNSINSICSDVLGNIYVAGDFTNSNGAHYVAKWDGVQWSELGGTSALNANGVINAVRFDNGNLYAAGAFKNTSGSYYVAFWNGTMWSELGSNLNTTAQIFCVFVDSNHKIYTSGKYVYMYDNGSWSNLDSLNWIGIVKTVCCNSTGAKIVAGGTYYTPVNSGLYVALDSSSSWKKLGTSLGYDAIATQGGVVFGCINALCYDGLDNLYVLYSASTGGPMRYSLKKYLP